MSKIQRKVPYCENCDQIDVEYHEVDHGGWEEFWGAKVWHHQYVDVCAICGEEIDFISPMYGHRLNIPHE